MYQFPIRKKRKRYESPFPEWYPEGGEEKEEEPGLIQGKNATILEWRVYKSLLKRKIDFIFQYPIAGGRMLRGGQVIDFVVVSPFLIPVNVNGDYWHEAELSSEERLLLAAQKQHFGRDPVVLWGHELTTQEACDQAVDRKII